MQADVIELRAQREVGQNAKIHAAADAIREVGIGTAPVANRYMPRTCQELKNGVIFVGLCRMIRGPKRKVYVFSETPPGEA